MRSTLLALGLLAVFAAHADETAKSGKHHAVSTATSQRVFIDPVTKRPRAPTPEELANEQANIAPAMDARSAATPRTVTLPDGVVGFYPGKNRNKLQAHRGKDGRITMTCSDAPARKTQP